METTLLTLWSIPHFLSGVAFGLIFNLLFMGVILALAGISILAMILTRNKMAMIAGTGLLFIAVIELFIWDASIKQKKKIDTLTAMFVTLFFLIIWEIFEESIGVPFLSFPGENLLNKVGDVAIGFLGFLITYFILKKRAVKREPKQKVIEQKMIKRGNTSAYRFQ